MNATDDDDIKLQKASASLLPDFQRLLNKVLWRRPNDAERGRVHRRVRESDLEKLFSLIEPFQEDPQLLDTHLKSFIPPLVSAYLDYIQISPRPTAKKNFIPLSHAVFRVLNLFCKVRGEKVIVGFLGNEPRYLEPILAEFEKGDNVQQIERDGLSQHIVSWEEKHILLLWLSHLMLTPFPLSSISANQPSSHASAQLGTDLPSELPGITLRLLPICIKGLESATKERGASASLLVRLSTRPDMQEAGLLNALVKWALSFFSKISESLSDIHQCLGVLTFLSGLVTSANNQEIGPFLPAIYNSCQNIISQGTLIFVRSSAAARKLVVKTLRNIVVHCLQTVHSEIDSMVILEEVIEFLLDAVGDSDTPVRYAASKALSIITLKLESEMAGEVVEAILGSLNENVYWQGSKRNLSGVNPLRWHGLTLTLSHLLYRRAPSTDQLPDVLNALLLALSFEQRSATGGSIGTNVRDAACFGVWALARRYTTKELLAVETSSIRASQQSHHTLSIPQVLAIELLVTACLDPAGNIRRGSSAALQELIGRHPNTVEEGIPLVQIVDFHAVGLRDRAMCEVAIQAAELRQMYWAALFDNTLEWRGVGSIDVASRLSAAKAVGLLSRTRSPELLGMMADRICDAIKALASRQVEERHGIIMALSSMIDQVSMQYDRQSEYPRRTDADLLALAYRWTLFNDTLKFQDKAFTSHALRPELTAVAVCSLLGSLASISNHLLASSKTELVSTPDRSIIHLLELCLGRNEESVLQAIPRAATSLLKLAHIFKTLSDHDVARSWIEYLQQESSYNGLKGSGYAIALGAVYAQLGPLIGPDTPVMVTVDQRDVVKVLTFRCTSAVEIVSRTVALQALSVLLNGCRRKTRDVFTEDIKTELIKALHTALNDYTVTERGDVGSLVRLEALNTVSTAWIGGSFGDTRDEQLHADVLRLSLEKLDKIRTRAAGALDARPLGTDTVSTHTYFLSRLGELIASHRRLQESVLMGYISSAGMGSESVVQNSRLALIEFIDGLPSTSKGTDDPSLLSITFILLDLFKTSLDNERVLIPLMETISFLLDMQVLHRLVDTSFPFRTLLSLTQKSHYKSTNMAKLFTALDVYRGLGVLTPTRTETLKKLTSMLLHPFPNVRIRAAETLWVLSDEQGLKDVDWGRGIKELKGFVEGVKAGLHLT